jgi:hypothetical protein
MTLQHRFKRHRVIGLTDRSTCRKMTFQCSSKRHRVISHVDCSTCRRHSVKTTFQDRFKRHPVIGVDHTNCLLQLVSALCSRWTRLLQILVAIKLIVRYRIGVKREDNSDKRQVLSGLRGTNYCGSSSIVSSVTKVRTESVSERADNGSVRLQHSLSQMHGGRALNTNASTVSGYTSSP